MDVTRLSNRDLLHGLIEASPDDPRWVEFVGRFQGRLRSSVLRCVVMESARNPGLDAGSPQDTADDLTQEVLIRLLGNGRRALSRFRGRSEQSIYTYLNAIGVNLVRDHFKKLRAAKAPKAAVSLANVISQEEQGDIGPTYDQALVCEGPGPERFVASREIRSRISTAIQEVSGGGDAGSRDRLIFRLYFIEGLTVDEIARIRPIGLSPSGVEKCIRRIRDALKRAFGKTEGGSPGEISSN